MPNLQQRQEKSEQMDFLNPKDVEAWLAEHRLDRRLYSDVLPQFVRALAAVDPSWDVKSTQRATAVARLLVKAMDGGGDE